MPVERVGGIPSFFLQDPPFPPGREVCQLFYLTAVMYVTDSTRGNFKLTLRKSLLIFLRESR